MRKNDPAWQATSRYMQSGMRYMQSEINRTLGKLSNGGFSAFGSPMGNGNPLSRIKAWQSAKWAKGEEGEEATGQEEAASAEPQVLESAPDDKDDKKERYRLNSAPVMAGKPGVIPTGQQGLSGKKGKTAGSRCYGTSGELSPERLREAVKWSEILGEPVSKRRRRKRMER